MIIHLMTVAPQKTEELPDQTIPACTIVSNLTFFFSLQLKSLVSEQNNHQNQGIRLTCHGHSLTSTSWPPTILVDLWAIPQVQSPAGLVFNHYQTGLYLSLKRRDRGKGKEEGGLLSLFSGQDVDFDRDGQSGQDMSGQIGQHLSGQSGQHI